MSSQPGLDEHEARSMMPEQRRGRAIAMKASELDSFLSEQRTCRVATLGPGGGPHVSPVWFVWDTDALWIYSLIRSQRWADLQRDPRVAVVIDAGEKYAELHGVEIEGQAAAVGPVPRTGGEALEGPEAPGLARTERLMARKYRGSEEMAHDGRHAWLRIMPLKIVSWDFRKLGLP
jgi:PPOX class probable F420-dependent enzyme